MLRRCFEFLLLLALVIVISLVLVPHIVSAAAHPDSDPSIDEVHVNRNLIETGDVLIYALYDIPYASVPDERVDQLFIFRLIDTDGTTELGRNEAYAYVNKGFGQGVISFYFDAEGAPTWGENYYIRISEKPDQFDDAQNWNFVIAAGDYTSQTTQSDNRDEVITNVIILSRTLEAEWGTAYDLLTETDTGTVLSEQGETYFRNSIYGLQAMCSELFMTIVVDPDYSNLGRIWNQTEAIAVEGRLTGTQPSLVVQSWADMFTVDFHLIAGVPLLLASLGFIVASVKWNNNAYSGMMCAACIIVVGFANGWLPRGAIAITELMCAFLLIGLLVKKLLPA